MEKINAFLRDHIVSFNNKINLTLILIISLLTNFLILYFFKFDKSLVVLVSFDLMPLTLALFFVVYALYMIEMTKRTYKNRDSRIRVIGKLLQIPNVVLAGVSLSIVIAHIFFGVISDAEFLYLFPVFLGVNICAFANFLLNYANERDLKGFICYRKKSDEIRFE